MINEIRTWDLQKAYWPCVVYDCLVFLMLRNVASTDQFFPPGRCCGRCSMCVK